MQTHCFIGTDKNAGKTTAFNAVYAEKVRRGQGPLLLTSIGINGETTDEFDGGMKPSIRVMDGTFFVTAGEHLCGHTGKYETLATFVPPAYGKPLVLGLAKTGFDILLEGPNTGLALGRLKEALKGHLSDETTILVDGSIDRQFLANPDLCDGFYFSVLFSKRAPQRKKAEAFLSALSFGECSGDDRNLIQPELAGEPRSLVFDEDGTCIYKGTLMPFADKALHQVLGSLGKKRALLYLDGALTSSLAAHLSPLKRLRVVLHNMTLYQNVSAGQGKNFSHMPEITVLHPVPVKGIFLREEAPFDRSLLPAHFPVHNLFREGIHGTFI